MRKVTQIAVINKDDEGALYALCDDGTIWYYEDGWYLHDLIPQDDIDDLVDSEEEPSDDAEES